MISHIALITYVYLNYEAIQVVIQTTSVSLFASVSRNPAEGFCYTLWLGRFGPQQAIGKKPNPEKTDIKNNSFTI